MGGPQGRTVGGPYVGGRYFDPMGLCRGSPEQTLKYKWNEVRAGGGGPWLFLVLMLKG